jgi:hypothetical protein
MVITCALNGCNTLFAWNGRHAIQSQTLIEGHTHTQVTTELNRRYTIAVQAIFDPEHVGDSNGMAAAEAKLSLVVKAQDPGGQTMAELKGWLDPNEPPNVFYTRPLKERSREIRVERLVSPFQAATVETIGIDVDLGEDRIGQYPILEKRLVIYDDALPSPIRNAVIGLVAGGLAWIAGVAVLLVGWSRGRRKRKRSGLPRAEVV